MSLDIVADDRSMLTKFKGEQADHANGLRFLRRNG